VHPVSVLGVYDKIETRYLHYIGARKFPRVRARYIQRIGKIGTHESPGFGYGRYRQSVHAESGGCLVFVVQRTEAVFALAFRTCSESSVRVAYHAAARRRGAGARSDRASRLAEIGTARAAHALLKIFNCARGGVGSVVFSVQRGLCNGPGLASGAEYSRRRSSTLDLGSSGK